MIKIKEIITEPTKLYVGETFKIKIKTIRHLIYEEIKKITINDLKKFTINQIKGEE